MAPVRSSTTSLPSCPPTTSSSSRYALRFWELRCKKLPYNNHHRHFFKFAVLQNNSERELWMKNWWCNLKLQMVLYIFTFTFTSMTCKHHGWLVWPVLCTFPYSSQSFGSRRPPALSTLWCCLSTLSSLYLVFSLLSLCLARWSLHCSKLA